MTDDNYLLFAGVNSEPEIFYTVEGEGRFAGFPSVFLRLFGCNLTCKGFASVDSPYGCDSFVSWSQKNKLTFDETFALLEKNGYIEKLQNGALLKITGGEPLLRQEPLINFIKRLAEKYEFLPRIDIETNGTVMPHSDWVNLFSVTFTVSPKLALGGDPEDKRYVPEVLKVLVQANACFKFVVKSEEDVKEIDRNFVNSPVVKLPKSLIWLMPCCGSRDEQSKQSAYVADICKQYCVKFSPRLQLMIWNKALSV